MQLELSDDEREALARFHGGYYGGTAVAILGYAVYGAPAAGAAVGAAAYAAARTNYYPPPYYQPPGW